MNHSANDFTPGDIAELYSDATIAERIKVAQKRVNLDDSEMKEIVIQYIQDTPAMFENLNHAWQRNDHNAMMLYAHSIVGVARLLKLNEVGEYAKAVEDRARDQLQPDEDTLILLNEHHNASMDALRKLY
jgi:HPt (histidine-containing phosphotransfer) domain-containing protein